LQAKKDSKSGTSGAILLLLKCRKFLFSAKIQVFIKTLHKCEETRTGREECSGKII
jgi:hypothetical protein